MLSLFAGCLFVSILAFVVLWELVDRADAKRAAERHLRAVPERSADAGDYDAIAFEIEQRLVAESEVSQEFAEHPSVTALWRRSA